MQNYTLLADFYQLTMMQSYFFEKKDDIAIFDVFFRKYPCNGGYAILCGINEVVEFIQNLNFSDDDLDYLQSLNKFDKSFLNYLKTFKFNGEIYAMREGSVVFAHEPLLRIKASILEAGFIEAAILNIINHQTLIATKSSRITQSAGKASVMEFGLRRAQGVSAGIYGSKAAFVGGCAGTSNVLAAKKFDIPVLGTHSHAWIQSFDSEIEAFRTYAKMYPKSTLLLVDTYDTLESGVPNAITVFKELASKGYRPLGIRIDSGDLEYLTKQARKMLDNAGFKDATITASSDLDEYVIDQLNLLGAKIDSWGIGTKLITSNDCPSLGGVYKMSGIVKDSKIIPKIKISNDPRKINNPCYKQVFRIYDKATNKAVADLITLNDEIIDENKELEIFHPLYTYKRKKISNFYVKKLLEPLFINGEFVGKKYSVKEIAEFAKSEKESMWEEYLRNIHPQSYKVDLSNNLYDIRKKMINKTNLQGENI